MLSLDLTLQKIKQTLQLDLEKININNYKRNTLNKEKCKIMNTTFSSMKHLRILFKYDYKAIRFCIKMNDFVLAVEIYYSTVRDV